MIFTNYMLTNKLCWYFERQGRYVIWSNVYELVHLAYELKQAEERHHFAVFALLTERSDERAEQARQAFLTIEKARMSLIKYIQMFCQAKI